MVEFNELHIIEDTLIIDVRVKDESYYTDVYLDSIAIDNQDTFVSEDYPSSKALDITFEEDKKRAKVILGPLDLKEAGFNLSDMLFIFVRTKGAPAPDTPCGLDINPTLKVVVDLYPYYQQTMEYIGELGRTCNVPQNFIDYLLRIKGMEVAIMTGNYTDAIKLFNKFFKGKTDISVGKGGCSCGTI